jgi:hypothetical protein
MAMLFGVMPPFWILVPFIAAGNVVLVLSWHFIGHIKPFAATHIAALAVAAGAKFCAIYFGVHTLIPQISAVKLPPPVLTAMSITQLYTAAIGGALSLAAIPILNKALKR